MEQVRVREIMVEVADAIDDASYARVPTFCFEMKALPAAEQFLLARYTLHEQVYFHKTTRCVEHIIAMLLRRIAECAKQLPGAAKESGLDETHPLLRFFAERGAALVDYLALDDTVVLGALERMIRAADSAIADVAARLRERRLYKTLDLRATFGADEGSQRQAARRIDRHFAGQLNDGTVIKDQDASVSIYTQIGGDDERAHKKLHILDAKGPREITEISRIIGPLGHKTQFTRYYFAHDSDRELARSSRRDMK
jgi:hypothetical protein